MSTFSTLEQSNILTNALSDCLIWFLDAIVSPVMYLWQYTGFGAVVLASFLLIVVFRLIGSQPSARIDPPEKSSRQIGFTSDWS